MQNTDTRPANARRSSPRIRAVLIGLSLVSAVAAGLTATATATAAAPSGYGIWGDTVKPISAPASDTKPAELGLAFSTSKTGWVTAIRYYKFAEGQGATNGTLWSSTGNVLARAAFSSRSGSGWKTAPLATPVRLTAGVTYVASYTAPAGRYAADRYRLGDGRRVTTRELTALQGRYSYSLGFPNQSWSATNYYADVLFTTSNPTPAPAPNATAAQTTTAATRTTTAPTTAPSAVSPAAGPCASRPSGCGYPDATNTGVPGGTTLRSVPGQLTSGPGWHYDSRGWIQIDGNGAVLDSISTTASIDVTASNVTIKNSRITVPGESWGIATRHTTNVTIQNNEISGPAKTGSSRLMVGIKDIYGDSSGLKVVGNDIWHTSTGVQIESGLIQDNYIHDLGFTSGDHVNGTTSNGGSVLLTVRHNTIFNEYQQTDAISLFQDFGPQANRRIESNLIAGGGYTLYAGANPGKTSTATNIAVVGNRFARTYFATSGYYGPATAYTSTGGNTWTGNVWDDTGKTVSP